MFLWRCTHARIFYIAGDFFPSAHFMSRFTLDHYKDNQLPVDTEPEVAAATLKLLEEYGLDVPKEKWREALRGTAGFEDKVVCTDDRELQPQELEFPEEDTIQTLFPSSALEVLYAVTPEELLKLDRYHFAKVASRTGELDRKLKAGRALQQKKIHNILRNHFYTRQPSDLPADFELHYNELLRCAVVCRFISDGFRYWFLELPH